MRPFPRTQKEFLEAVARETCRMSYPGSMSRGKKQVLKEHTKKKIEEEFFPKFLGGLWNKVDSVANQFDEWHEKQARNLGHYLRENGLLGNPKNNGDIVGAKLINTFMYQLMKYERFRPLWSRLHLPLDRKMLAALLKLESKSVGSLKEIHNSKGHPYQLSYEDYMKIQKVLLQLLNELNERDGAQYKVKSRIELNLLWSDDRK